MRCNHLKSAALGMVSALALSTSTAFAGGFDRGGVNIDQLFDQSRFGTIDAQATFVFPDRDQLNVTRDVNVATAPLVAATILGTGLATPADVASPAAIGAFLAANPAVVPAVAAVTAATAPLTADEINTDSAFVVPRIGYKQKIAEGFDCLFSYSEPFGADNNNGTFNALSASSVSFFIDTQDYGATCSLGFGVGEVEIGGNTFESSLKVIGGVSYQELDGFLSRQSFLDFALAGIPSLVGSPIEPIIAGGAAAGGVPAPVVTVTNTAGLGTFTVDGDAVGYRVGLAYEIPEIALRVLAIYNSAYDYDLSGVQDNTGFGIAAGAANAAVPISLTTEIPQSVEVKLQSGISENMLAFVNLKWQDWSQLGIIPIGGGVTATVAAAGGAATVPTTLAFEPLYRDGFTVTGGVGMAFSEQVSGLASLTWDRGTATTVGSQTDSWTLSGGISYKEGDNFEFRFGGAVGILTGGISTGEGTSDPANSVFYEFDTDLLLAANLGAKYKF